MFHRDDDIALFVPAVDVPVRLHHLFQRIGPIDDRLQGARLGQFLEYHEIRWHWSRKRVVDRGDLAARRQRALRVHQGGRALSPPDSVEDDVVALRPTREILARVIDDGTSAERFDQLEVGGAAHTGHMRAEVPNELNGRRADGTRSAVHQDMLPGFDIGSPDEVQGYKAAVWKRSRFLEGQVGWPRRQHAARWPTDVLRVRAEHALAHAEHRVTHLERGDVSSEGVDLPGQHHAEDGSARRLEPEQQAEQEPIPGGKFQAPHQDVACRHGGREDLYAYLVASGSWGFHLFELKKLWWPVSCTDDCFHKYFSKITWIGSSSE